MDPLTAAAQPAPTLTARMRARTAALHVQAERSGVVAAILRGQATPEAYALYLRNLLPAYQAMEQALRPLRLVPEAVYRADSIAADLRSLAGPGWHEALALLPAGQDYAARIAAIGDGPLLAAHVYTRYLGDLNGGRILRPLLIRLCGSDFPNAFTAFDGIADVAACARDLLAALNTIGGDADGIIEEAAHAFELNIRLSEAVAAHGSA